MFKVSWNFSSYPTEVILVSADHSHYIYFNGSTQPYVESLYPEIIALDAFAPETGLSSDGINLDIAQVISSGRSLGPPLQQLTDSLVNREFQIGNVNGDQSIDFELQGGSLHYVIDPYHIPFAYGVGYLQPSAANAEFIQQYIAWMAAKATALENATLIFLRTVLKMYHCEICFIESHNLTFH